MTELAIILIALLNVALLVGREQKGYVTSRLESASFALSLPVALLSFVLLGLLGGPVVLSLIAGAVVAFGLLLFLLLVADAGANA